MSEVFTDRAGRTWATHLGSPEGRLVPGDKKLESTPARSCSDTRSEPGRGQAASPEQQDPLIGSPLSEAPCTASGLPDRASGHRAIDGKDSTSGQPLARDRANGAESRSSNPPAPPRIRIDVAFGTSYLEIQSSIFRQAWQMAGTQLRAAIALGITPETISRVLRFCDRKGIGCPKVPEAWPVVADNRATGRSTDPVIGRSGDRVMGGQSQPPVARIPFAENEESDSFLEPEDEQQLNTDD